MKEKATHYDLIKSSNQRLIRNLVRVHKHISKKELVELSGLTFPTVSAAIGELVEQKELLMSVTESNGGRPGTVYEINPSYGVITCMRIRGCNLEIVIYDHAGGTLEQYTKSMPTTANVATLIEQIKKIQSNYPNLIYAVLGIPGVAVNGVIKHLTHFPHLEGQDVKKEVMRQVGITLQIENDINSIAMGDVDLGESFAHIIWTDGCIGSAICMENHILQGAHGCAGEVDIICDEKKGKMPCLSMAVKALSCIIDVPVIAISGEEVTDQDITQIQEMLAKELSPFRVPKIVYKAEEEQLYERGLWQIARRYLDER